MYSTMAFSLLDTPAELRREPAFLLYTADFSRIQRFIYTVHTEGALRSLRSRSFFLELLMEALHGRAAGRLRPDPDQHHLQRRRALLSPAAQHRRRAADPCRLEPGLQRLAERTVRRAAVPGQRLAPPAAPTTCAMSPQRQAPTRPCSAGSTPLPSSTSSTPTMPLRSAP